jgi:hypothetical protein
MTITQEAIEQRATAIAQRQALEELQREEQQRATRDQAARAETTAQGRAILVGVTDRLRREAGPMYQRREEILREIAPALAELIDLEARFAAFYPTVGGDIDRAARLVQRMPADLVRETRAAAGVPTAHDQMPEDLADVARVVGRALAAGLIGPDGIGHPNMRGFLKL